jgi:hypothetical protein
MNIDEIIKRLIGNISAQGDTSLDEIVMKNLDYAETIFMYIFNRLESNAYMKDYPQYSIRQIANKSIEILEQVKKSNYMRGE